MPDDRKYVRVYYSIGDDPKFDDIRSHDANLATWLRLLMLADAVWPATADLPRWARRGPLDALSSAGLVDVLPGDRFRIHGLDAERTARSNAGRNAAAMRWHGNGIADPMPSRAETRRDKTKGIQGD